METFWFMRVCLCEYRLWHILMISNKYQFELHNFPLTNFTYKCHFLLFCHWKPFCSWHSIECCLVPTSKQWLVFTKIALMMQLTKHFRLFKNFNNQILCDVCFTFVHSYRLVVKRNDIISYDIKRVSEFLPCLQTIFDP